MHSTPMQGGVWKQSKKKPSTPYHSTTSRAMAATWSAYPVL